MQRSEKKYRAIRNELVFKILEYGHACAEERQRTPCTDWPLDYWSEQRRKLRREIVARVDSLIADAQKRK
jgi:hypothetical protein